MATDTDEIAARIDLVFDAVRRRRRRERRRRWVREFGPALVAAVASLGWLAAVAINTDDGVFGQAAAGWAQAIGTVWAFAVVIWIDGRARRIQQERETAGAQAFLNQRREALNWCSTALAGAATAAALITPGSQVKRLPERVVSDVDAARAAVNGYVALVGDTPGDMVKALQRMAQLMSRFVTLHDAAIVDGRSKEELESRLRKSAFDALSIIAEYENIVL